MRNHKEDQKEIDNIFPLENLIKISEKVPSNIYELKESLVNKSEILEEDLNKYAGYFIAEITHFNTTYSTELESSITLPSKRKHPDI